MMASPSTDIVLNAWDALASRLKLAQREAAMRPGSALALGHAGAEDLDAHGLGVHKIEVEKLAARASSSARRPSLNRLPPNSQSPTSA